ncbi:contractile injection system protein, VgrG/Pvc8 family [Actinoplanes sp. NEAU-A12]|uniref:Contractile injection system protein, VgrG/Pvc8 family n=1 Tax=Actinoplanes sandaracinus TaxID=3045177 RepID=A0ABT6WWJ9_9ACTN|nr:contractile injection system protein, VgrG/Pvc8 family [Actinoplanes sandaracinus]MDI6104122.1 contractile injection system protein, VgrG/Pvc8 family [Actinoplanes sandaracinus]
MPLGVAIAVDGTVDASLASASWVEVHERLGRPTVFRLRFEFEASAGDFGLLVDDRLSAGAELSVLVPGAGGNECLVAGPVGAQRVHFEHGGAGSYVEVRGSDTSITMDRQARSALWPEVTDSDAVTSIISSYGLAPDVESTAAGHYENKHTLVQRESDLAFVRRLARRNGYAFWVTADPTGVRTAHFRRPPTSGPAAVTLTINKEPPHLRSLDLTWDTERPTSVEGMQVDLNTKADLDGAMAESPLAALGSDDLAAITGDTRSMFLAAPVDDAGDLRARSAGALTESYFFVRATGETTRERVGRAVRAHTVLDLRGAGSRHSGSYLVAGVRHTIDAGSHRMEIELLRNAWGA